MFYRWWVGGGGWGGGYRFKFVWKNETGKWIGGNSTCLSFQSFFSVFISIFLGVPTSPPTPS